MKDQKTNRIQSGGGWLVSDAWLMEVIQLKATHEGSESIPYDLCITRPLPHSSTRIIILSLPLSHI